jgi:hypothetical protein
MMLYKTNIKKTGYQGGAGIVRPDFAISLNPFNNIGQNR